MLHRLVALFTFFNAFACAADEPAWKKNLSSPDPGSYQTISPCVIDLQVTWNGMIDSGKLRIEFAPKDAKKSDVYIVRSSASSLGPAAVLFPYQCDFWSELDPTSLKPKLFHAVETDNSETSTSDTRHFNDRVEYQENTKPLDGRPPTRKERVFKFNPVFDIFSAMLHVRSQKLEPGDLITLVVHPSGSPYLLNVKVIARELHLDRKTIRLSVGLRKINRKTLELAPYKKMKKDATLWLSDDAERIPVELRAAVFIGDIRATLTGYQKL
jgi:hypothetical protein